jgi:hypothetical protein
VGGTWERKSPAKSLGATRDINKTGRYTPYKKTINPEALAKSIQTRQKGEAGLRASGDNDAGHEGQDGGDSVMLNLVGAHGEPTRSNECSMLELPRDRALSDNSRVVGSCKSQ